MSAGLLFEGIGGFGLAAERVGIEPAWCSEIDPHASRVLDYHWPHVKNLGDIHGIRNAPRVDVLTGGFPCQDYSVAGTRGGLAGDRGALWWQYLRLIAELRPAWVVGENVPGLLSSNGGRDFETIVGSLTECGYGVAWAVLDAQYFGVAQRRRRVFIVGHSGGEPRPEILALGEGVFGHPEPRRETGEGTAPTLAARTRDGGWPGSDEAIDGAVIASSLTAAHKYDQDGNESWLVPELAATLTQGAPFAGRRQEDDYNVVAFSAGNHESSYGLGLSEEHTPPIRAGESGTNQVPTIAFAQNQRDELRELDVASSVNAERWGTVKNETLLADPPSVRRLTPLECERLQGFPDGWTDIPGNSDTQRYRQLGNAVAVPVAEWVMRRIVEAA